MRAARASSLVAFATLSPVYRTDGSALINLVRNVGSAIGISLTTTMLAVSVQQIHAQMSEHFNPFNRNLGVNAQSLMWNPQLPFGLQQLSRIVEYNAEVIAYANDFLFMFFISGAKEKAPAAAMALLKRLEAPT